MMSERGYFFVIDGIDGSGGETQTKILKEKLEKKGYNVFTLRYPDREGKIGKLIYEYLEDGIDLSLDTLFLLYFLDFVKDKNKIEEWLKAGNIVIADRYFTSTLAYQSAQGFSIEKSLKLAKLFHLPIPDLAFLLRIPPEVSISRKYGEKGNLDRFESNKIFLEKVAKMYEKLATEQIFCKWKIIDANKSIEEVANDIWEEVEKII